MAIEQETARGLDEQLSVFEEQGIDGSSIRVYCIDCQHCVDNPYDIFGDDVCTVLEKPIYEIDRHDCTPCEYYKRKKTNANETNH